MARFLIIDDEVNAVVALRELLELDGHEVAAFTDAGAARLSLQTASFDAVLTGLESSRSQIAALVHTARECQGESCIFLLSTGPVRPMEQACHAFEKPLDYESVVRMVTNCRQPRRRGCFAKRASEQLG